MGENQITHWTNYRFALSRGGDDSAVLMSC